MRGSRNLKGLETYQKRVIDRVEIIDSIWLGESLENGWHRGDAGADLCKDINEPVKHTVAIRWRGNVPHRQTPLPEPQST